MRTTLGNLAREVGGRLDGPAELELTGVAGLRDARAGDLSFVSRPKYLSDLETTAASAVIAFPDAPASIPAIRVDDPYVAFLKAIRVFARPITDFVGPGVHPTAIVDPTARLGSEVRVAAGAIVGRDCVVGERSIIGAGVVLGPEVKVGSDCILHPNATVREECEIGDRCILQPGAVLGSDGFGFAKADGVYHKIPQIGKVVLEDDVEIGANTCVDRATTGRTVIQRGTKLDNLVQIAHNVRVGENTVISAQTGVSGSATIGSDVVLAGQVGVQGHIRIADGVQVGGQSGVTKSVTERGALSGLPARDHAEWRRISVHMGRLPRYADELAELKRRVAALEGD